MALKVKKFLYHHYFLNKINRSVTISAQIRQFYIEVKQMKLFIFQDRFFKFRRLLGL